MKFATFVLLGIPLLGSFASLKASDPAWKASDSPGASQVAFGFTGRSTCPANPTPTNPCTCFWYLPLVQGLDEGSLFNGGTNAANEANARLMWVSDFTIQLVFSNGPFTLYLIPEGTGTIYFNATPSVRDLKNRRTLGVPVATFVRRAALYVSQAPASGPPPDPEGWLDTFIFSADLVSTNSFKLDGKNSFDFKHLIQHGMTCHETISTKYGAEAGSCVAVGGGS